MPTSRPPHSLTDCRLQYGFHSLACTTVRCPWLNLCALCFRFPPTSQTLDPAEESEFSRAASLFQPLSSTMANRFTSASAAPVHVLEPETVPVGLQSAEAMAQFRVRRALPHLWPIKADQTNSDRRLLAIEFRMHV